jgi:hypothetical protein
VERVDTTPERSPDDEGTSPGTARTPPDAAAADEHRSDRPGAQNTDGDDGDAGIEETAAEEIDAEEIDAEETDADETDAGARDPLRFNNWMKRSATGAVMTGISLGLREALENKKNEPAFMIEASGQPEDPDNPISLHFDPDNPADTVAIIRRKDGPDPDPPPG